MAESRAHEPSVGSPDEPGAFIDDARRSLQHLRGALTELLAANRLDPHKPSVLARSVGVDRKLAWKISRIVQAKDEFDAVQHMPGTAGFDKFLLATAERGATADSIERVRSALRDFDRMVEIHTGDRASLELTLQSMSTRPSSEGLDAARRLAFQGNSAIWGLQARVRLTANFLAPNADDPTMVDVAQIAGFDGLRRLRPTVRWPLFRITQYQDGGASPIPFETIDPIRHGTHGDLPLLTDYTSDPLPGLGVQDLPNGQVYELLEGPVGRTGAVSIYFATVVRALGSAYRDAHSPYAELSGRVTVPVKDLQQDLFVHRDLNLGAPRLIVLDAVDSEPEYPLAEKTHRLIPVPEQIHEIGSGPPVVATPLLPRYPAMFAHLMNRLGWDPAEFSGYRLTMRYPPMPSVACALLEIPER